MKTSLTGMRRTLLWSLNSRMGLRQPFLLMNSIPKSGTHLAKAVLEGAGYAFAGHYGHSEHKFLSMPAETNGYFATAHITQPVVGPGLRLLVYRDPVDVALSMVIYIRSRVDHPRRTLLSKMSLEAAALKVFEGVGDLEPLADRYAAMCTWARDSAARPVNFDLIKSDPAGFLEDIGLPSPDMAVVRHAMNKWNPTKRTTQSAEELELKDALRRSAIESVRETFDAYKKIKSLA